MNRERKMIEKEYYELKENDIWTTDLQHSFFAMKGPKGIPMEGVLPEDADIWVDINSIPGEFFD